MSHFPSVERCERGFFFPCARKKKNKKKIVSPLVTLMKADYCTECNLRMFGLKESCLTFTLMEMFLGVKQVKKLFHAGGTRQSVTE